VQEIEIRLTGYLAPDAQLLTKAAMADLVERYDDDKGDATRVDPVEFEPPTGSFFVAYLDGEPVACGAWRSHDEDATVAEIKRMYTAPQARGRGLARAVLSAVERSAREHGRRTMILATGTRQPEAIKLYESSGYRPIPTFGYYRDDPECRCYARDLRAP
jgi:GNAT superfamily N-acetyltransferase